MGDDSGAVFLGIVEMVGPTPARRRGVAKNNRSVVISKPVRTLFSGLKYKRI